MMNLSKRKIIILVSLAIFLIIGVLVYLIFSNRPADEPVTQLIGEPLYTSMEDGSVVTQSDIDSRVNMENTAKDAAIAYFHNIYPDSQSISFLSTEWYFTDKNNSDNILVSVTLVNKERYMNTEMIVVELTEGKSDGYEVVSLYEPDERYEL